MPEKLVLSANRNANSNEADDGHRKNDGYNEGSADVDGNDTDDDGDDQDDGVDSCATYFLHRDDGIDDMDDDVDDVDDADVRADSGMRRGRIARSISFEAFCATNCFPGSELTTYIRCGCSPRGSVI